jgi:hypothetical protein
MKQHTRRLAIALGGALLTTVGFLAACSTDNGTTPIPTTTGGGDSGNKKGDSGGSSTDDDDSGSKVGTDGGASADCATAPKLRNNDQGFRCAFLTPPDGGSRNCGNDEVCCNPGAKTAGGKDFPNSYCAPKSGGADGPAACAAGATAAGSEWVATKSSTWQCADKSACGGKKCCMFTWASTDPNDKVNIGKTLDKDIPAACNALMAFKAGGTRCADECDATEIPLCSLSDDNCSGNQTCTPFSAYRDLGYCK